MKKRILAMVAAGMMCLCLSACAGGSNPDNEPARPNDTPANDPAVATSESAALAAPVMESVELYNPNGFDTVTAVISNPNSVAIDVTYDLVYYKDGKETARSEAFSNFAILPGHKDVIWANVDIPKSTDVDDVKMENVFVTQTSYEPIDGNYKYIGTTDGEALFDFTFERKPTLATITFLLYNDNNQNEQYDQGEIVVVGTDSLMEQTGRASFDTEVFAYTDYEVFFTAY